MTGAQVTGERIAFHRKRLGLSQAELATRIGRSVSWVSQVERGVRAVDRRSRQMMTLLPDLPPPPRPFEKFQQCSQR
jgi:transcriptional regulator with XRE-family HTH domain